MVTITISYIVYTPGHRHHHTGTQTNIIQPVNGTASSGDNIPITAFPTLEYNGTNLPFAFMSVTGGTNGNQLYTAPGTQNVPVGDENVNAVVVYAPVGGGSGEPGVWVDAFNVDTGNFSDSDFMSVYTNGLWDNEKTNRANDDGIVSSVTAEDMRSYNFVDGVPFMQWFKVGVSTPVNNIDYNLQIGETGIVFAFYKSTQPTIKPKNNYTAVWTYVSPGVLVDGGGFTIGPGGVGPVGPWGPLTARLLSTIAILSISETYEEPALKKAAVDLAVQNLTAISEKIKSTVENKLKS